jgi:hypothetical protein
VKRGTFWEGYKVHLTETYEPDSPNLITQVAATDSTVQDVRLVAPIHAHLAERGLLPDLHLVDRVNLVGPIPDSTSWQTKDGGFSQADFASTSAGKPAGYLPERRDKQPLPPRSCPASANRAWPRERITSTTSPATARLEYPAWSAGGAGPGGPAVTPEIGTDHGETALDQERGDAMPGPGCPGMAMEQHHRRPFPAVAIENRCFIDLNPLGLKALEHGPNLPPSFVHPPRHRPVRGNPSLAHGDRRANRLRKLPLVGSAAPTQPSAYPRGRRNPTT